MDLNLYKSDQYVLPKNYILTKFKIKESKLIKETFKNYYEYRIEYEMDG